MQIKDRVELRSGKRDDVGTVIKVQFTNGMLKTVGVLWDNEWPSSDPSKQHLTGRLFFYKSEDLQVVDTWRID